MASVLLTVSASAGFTACGDSGTRQPLVEPAPAEVQPKPPALPPVSPPSLVAAARASAVPVFDSPASVQPSRTLAHPTAEHYPLVFRVEERQGDWLKVFLPVRPNGSRGWIRAGDVTLSATTYRVVVELQAHRLRVYDGANVTMEEPVAVGTARHPTPLGDFYVDAIVQVPNPRGAYGPYQMSVAGFSNVLTRFAGGPGQIAVHGTNNPAALGTDVSHGCIRVRNEAITRMATSLPVGTPIQILA